ncbi:hypothetical protein K7432_008323 [Basidiobolus ranarum]|uniref:Methyltransferase domain-containing protein n=1 Tax=Basidiobolus ranarum TaxID=34480 RepID=A0ABR2VYT1_9FUNG
MDFAFQDREGFLPSHQHSTQTYLLQLAKLIDEYRWFLQLHVVDFFTQNHWDDTRIPTSWKHLEELISDDYEELIELAAKHKVQEDWPLELSELIQTIKKLELNRQPTKNYDFLRTEFKDGSWFNGMTPKKKHEVPLLTGFVETIAKQHSVRKVVDVGAGQGYLSCMLACECNFDVIAVDNNEIQTCGAKKRVNDIIKRIEFAHKKGNTNSTEIGKFTVVNEHVSIESFNSVIHQFVEENDPWLMCSLHACGDLSATMAHMFIQSDSRLLLNIGCCYNLLSEKSDSNPNFVGFPLSRKMKSDGYFLGRTLRMLACQAPQRWSNNENGAEFFKHNFYRALLQLIMVKEELIKITDEPPKIGKLRKHCFVSFEVYCQSAFARLNYPSDAVSSDTLHKYYQEYLPFHKRLAIFWTIRSLLAPLLEALVLMDRACYLQENDCEVDLLPIFDPIESPRNMVVLARKR